MHGHLDLVCGLGASGRSQLSRQSFSAPMHISKPYVDEETLVVNVVNPTAGLFEGDEVVCNVHVETGARLLLTTPSANRVHRAKGEGEARLMQHFSVADGGWLEFWPEIFIPQAGARYRQRTTISLEAGSGLMFVETLAPGRVASGEVFEFQYLDWEMNIRLGNERVVKEKYRITPANWQPFRRQFPNGYYASLFVFHPEITNQSQCWEAIRALHGNGVWIGQSGLHQGGWSVRLLAPDSIGFRKTLFAVREAAYESMGAKAPRLRKY